MNAQFLNCLIVIGRSAHLTSENRGMLTAIENQTPKLKIMTFDDVLANARAVVENTLGPLWDMGPSTQVFYLP